MEWIRISDRLPDKDCKILLFDGVEVFAGTFSTGLRKDGSRYSYFGIQGCDGVCYGNFERGEIITHWMPLPEPPKEK